METTLNLPDELIRGMELRALVQGRALGDLAADYLRQGLGMAAPRPPKTPSSDPMVEIGPRGLSVMRCRADAPTSRMSVEKLLKFEQQTQIEGDLQHAGLPV